MRELVTESQRGSGGVRGDAACCTTACTLERAAIRAPVARKDVAVIALFREPVMPPLRSGIADLHDLVSATLELATDRAAVTEELPAARIGKIIAGCADGLRSAPLCRHPRPVLRAQSAIRPTPVCKPSERPTVAVETIPAAARAVGNTPRERRFIAGNER